MAKKCFTLRMDPSDLAELDLKRGEMSRNEAICEAVKSWKPDADPNHGLSIVERELEIKNEQIAQLQRLLDQQQQLALAHSQEHVLALGVKSTDPGDDDKPKGFFKRLKWAFTD